MNNKLRFILAIIEDKIVMKRVKKQVLAEKLVKMGFTKFSEIPKIKSTILNPKSKNSLLEGVKIAGAPQGKSTTGGGKGGSKEDSDSDEDDVKLKPGETSLSEFNYLVKIEIIWN